MASLAEKSRDLSTLVAVRAASDPETARRLVAGALPPLFASVMQPAELDAVRARLARLPEPPARASLDGEDGLGALGVCLLVFLSTFPVVIPFIVMRDAVPALRVSNAIAVVLLFAAGYAFGRLTGRHPVWVGTAMVLLGSILVGLTMALGG